MRIAENNLTRLTHAENGLLEQILLPENLNAAFKRVKRNRGAGGVDRMRVEDLRSYLAENKDLLIAELQEGKYRPQPVRRVEIPKENGKKRQLGIPTVVDRVIQQAITQILTPIYEDQFSTHSYGFRPNRNAQQAVEQSRRYITEGYEYAVDMDLEKFFDTVNQSKLIEVLSRTIKDGRVVGLIHKYLQAGVEISSKFESTEIGVPQGGPLSPLLSNIMLHELDKELEARGHRFVRYADDMIILCKSERAAMRTMSSVVRFIEEKLYLKVNREKSVVANITQVKFLGFSFERIKGEGTLRLHSKSVAKLKTRIKELTDRSNGWGYERRKAMLRQYIKGWINYFKPAEMEKSLTRLDGWYRRRLRMLIWKQWKSVRTRAKNLIKLGTNRFTAWEHANTRKGAWRVALSYILATSITNARLRQSGYLFLTDYYLSVRSPT